MAFGLHVQHWLVPFAFLTGGFFSGLCGYIGMRTATIAAHRTTAGARKSLNEGLRVAFRAGAVMGLVVVGFAVIDITFWFAGLKWLTDMPLHEITVVMLTFGMVQALNYFTTEYAASSAEVIFCVDEIR